MRPDDGPSPDRRTARQWLDRIRTAIGTAPLPVKILLVLALLAAAAIAAYLPAQVGDLILVLALGYGPVALWRKQRSVIASLAVAAWGLAAILFVAALTPPLTAGLIPLLLLRSRWWPRPMPRCWPAGRCPAGRSPGPCCGRCPLP